MVRCNVGGFVVAMLLYPAWCYGYSVSRFSSNTSSCSRWSTSVLALAAEYPDCNGKLSWIGDGYCNVATNTPSCGYDGGDCCVCTCFNGPEYDCGVNGFSCEDPDGVTAEEYGCVETPQSVLPCSMETVRPWVVDDTASAQALAEAMHCSGGVFDVAWYGNVAVGSTFYAIDGSNLTIVGNGFSASVSGISNTGLFVVVNATLNVIGVNVIHSGSTSGVIIAAGSSVVFNRTAFISNNARDRGSAVFVSGGSNVSFAGRTIVSNNIAVGSGGAVFVSDGSNVSFTGTTYFFGNSATASGGALFVSDGSSLLFAGTTIFSSNSAAGSGGALFVSDGSSVSFAGNNVFHNNTANVVGGAFARETNRSANSVLYGGGTLRRTDDSSLIWTGDTFEGNTQCSSSDTDFVSGGLGFGGGALYVSIGSTMSCSGPTSFLNNSAGYGGGVLVNGGSNVNSSRGTAFLDNSAEYGGAVLVNDGSNVSWSGDTSFVNNSAEYGGALFVNDGSNVSWIGNNSFVSNSAEVAGGAVGSAKYDSDVNAEESILTINGRTIFGNNTSGENGGGLAVLGALNVAFKEANVGFVGNYAGNAGGGVYLSGAGVGPVFSNVSFISNVAHFGGAFFAEGSGNEFRSDGDDQGGAVFAEGSGNEFRSDGDDQGGAVFAVGSGAEFRSDGDDQIQKPTTFKGCRFIQNKATATGGAIATASGRDVINNTLFMGNTAGVGGALRLAGTAYVNNCSFVENISDVEGGAAISNIGRVMQMDNTIFRRNIYSCKPGAFLDFNESLDVFDTACDGCDLECTGCSYDKPPLAPVCTEVMEHAMSPGGTTTLELLRIDRGYWRATNFSRDILPCYNADACLGGVTGTPNYCLQGYEGPYCFKCSDGYVANLGFSCTKCTNYTGIDLMFALALAVMALVVTIVVPLPARMRDAVTGFVERARRCLPRQSIQIFVVNWQILTQFAAVANAAYSNIYKGLLGKMDVINFDLGWIISAGCVVDVDFHDKRLISTFGPAIAMFSVGAAYSIVVHLHKGFEDVLRIVRHKHALMAHLLTFLVYSSVSVVLFEMYGCKKLNDDKYHLGVEYHIDCDSSKPKALQVYTGFMIALYTIGIPAIYTGLLLRSRGVLKDNAGRDRSLRARLTSDLWKPYKPTRFYYEVIECARRMLLAGVVVFIYPNTAAQIAVTIMIAMGLVFVSEGLGPYALRWDCWVNRMGHVLVLNSMYLALLLNVDVSTERASSEKIFEAVLESTHAFMVLTVAVEAVVIARMWPTQRRRDP